MHQLVVGVEQRFESWDNMEDDCFVLAARSPWASQSMAATFYFSLSALSDSCDSCQLPPDIMSEKSKKMSFSQQLEMFVSHQQRDNPSSSQL